MNTFVLVDLILGGLALYLVNVLVTRMRASASLPPGPKPKPILGNLFDLPSSGEQEWIHWLKHKELYGPISSVTVFGQTLIIINDQRIAFELLDKRSALHSSRPTMIFGGKMVGWENSLAVLLYSARFRAYRKNIHGFLGSKSAVARFYPLQKVEVGRFLLRVLEEPEKVLNHIRTEAGAIILKISHGYTIEPRGRDPLVDLADESLAQFSLAAVPGAWLVDTLPFLRYLLGWLPGLGFKRRAAQWRKTLMELTEKPHAFVKQQMAAGVALDSYSSALLERSNLSPEDEFVIKWSASSLYAGGADTTVSSLASFFLVMTVYPDVQRKAHEEIDRVVGNDRLPNFEDRVNLPYVDALVKEILRWHPIGPMGLPHTSTEDDMYEGYSIPKDALLLPNIWGFAHDPETYHDPMVFKPERFIGADGREPEMDPRSIAFGFGRRICPGRELADASIYLSIAQSLAVFDVRKALDENGKVIEPVVAFTPGVISHPVEYKTSITPRNEKAVTLIRAIEEEYPFTQSDAQALNSIDV